MKKLLAVLAVIAYLIVPVLASAELSVVNVSVLTGSLVGGTAKENVYDGNIATWLSLDASSAAIGVNYLSGTEIEYCDLYSRDSILRVFDLYPTGGSGNTSWRLSVSPNTWGQKIFPESLFGSVRVGVVDGNWFQLAEIKCYGSIAGPPVANYSCNFDYPYGPPPFSAVCVDNSNANPALSSQEWVVTNPDSSVYTTTNASLVRTLTQEGWYGMNYSVCNALGCGYKNTPAWINITSTPIQATGISFWVHNTDPITGAKVAFSQVGIRNQTTGAWRNISTNSGDVKFSATDFNGTEKLTAGQTIGLNGWAPGYEYTYVNVTIPYDLWEYNLNLIRTDALPAADNSTMIVNVINTYTTAPLSGVTITLTNSTIPYSSSKLSNTGGTATFTGLIPGSFQITASKTGFQSSTTSWSTTAGQVSNAYIGILPVGATPVVTDTGGNAIYDPSGNPIIGYDLSGNPITAGPTQDMRTDDEKAEGMMDIFYENGEGLILLFILFTIMFMIKGILWR